MQGPEQIRELSQATWHPGVYEIHDLDQRCAALVACGARFAERHRGLFYTRDPGEIATALGELGDLYGVAAALDGRTAAAVAVSAEDPAPHDRRATVAAALADLVDLVQFVEFEWLRLPDEARRALLADERLAAYRHYLTVVASAAGHTLTEEGETALAARDHAAEVAWVQLYQQVTRDLRPVVRGEPQTMERARRWLEADDRRMRVDALTAIYDAVEPMAPMLATCLDTLVADRLAVDELRELPHPRAERDLTNELPGTIVDGMLDQVTAGYAIARRWFDLKARLLGEPRLAFEDMRAPLGPLPTVAYGEAVGLALATFDRLGPAAGRIARSMFDGGRVDALPRDGKDTGALCRSLGPDALPCVFLSYFGTVEDAVCLVHELGHAVHFASAAPRTDGLTFDPPLAMTEIAPALAELLAYDLLVERQPDARRRRQVAAKRVEVTIEAVFFSALLTRFETRAHALRADGLVLTDQRTRRLWTETGRELYGPGVVLPPRWGLHWILVPHLVHARFYSYTYAFSRLVALRLHAAHRADPDRTSRAVIEMLGHGGSVDLPSQLRGVGIDIADPQTWRSGLAEIEAMIDAVTD